ncbi:cytochrome c [Vibrio kyushuensis]|uniref:c-type cytochrome n=1 Tax=Vibrio TaxID=662 RepID=UPI003D14578E
MTSISFIVLITGCDRDLHDHPELTTGQQLFEHHCSSCHQKTGQGRFLKGIPANRATALTEDQISHKITSLSVSGAKMPSFPNMPKEESDKISAYVKSL